MKKILIIVFFIQISMNAQSVQKNFIDQNYIEVTGKVETEIIPNEIYISITINEKDKHGKVSVEEQEAKLIKHLKLIGLDVDKNLSVENFNSSFNNFFFKKDEVYKTKQYSLMVDTTNMLSKVFKIFDLLEISNVFISKVNHSEIEKFKRDSKIKAIKIAKEKAKYYAEAINQTIGKALFIKEQQLYTGNYPNPLNSNIVLRGYASGVSKNKQVKDKISFKKIRITASVEAKFELK